MVILQYNLALVSAPVQHFSSSQCATCWQLSSDCFPDTTNQILPHLLLMLQNMCSAWLLFSSHSPFPGQEQPGLKIHAFEKGYSQNNSKPCASQGPPAGQESLQQCKSHLQAELEESKHDLLASPVTKSCCAFQTRRKPHWQCTESQGIRWTEISICVPNERPLDLTGPKPVSSPAATPMS